MGLNRSQQSNLERSVFKHYPACTVAKCYEISSLLIKARIDYNFSAREIETELHCRCTGRIQCEVLTTLPFCFSWIKKFLGQQSKI